MSTDNIYDGWDNSSAITFEPLFPSVHPPVRATEWSAGYDLRAFIFGRKVKVLDRSNVATEVYCPTDNPALRLLSGERALIPLGFKAKLPKEFEAQIRPRSGNAIKQGLSIINAPGTIDADFPGEWAVLVVNHGGMPVIIEHGDAVAQMVLSRFQVLPFRNGLVGVSTDRVGGYGSTGK
jgi:dUTP pyrophosphatase